jgi:hypothetical protein
MAAAVTRNAAVSDFNFIKYSFIAPGERNVYSPRGST